MPAAYAASISSPGHAPREVLGILSDLGFSLTGCGEHARTGVGGRESEHVPTLNGPRAEVVLAEHIGPVRSELQPCAVDLLRRRDTPAAAPNVLARSCTPDSAGWKGCGANDGCAPGQSLQRLWNALGVLGWRLGLAYAEATLWEPSRASTYERGRWCCTVPSGPGNCR